MKRKRIKKYQKNHLRKMGKCKQNQFLEAQSRIILIINLVKSQNHLKKKECLVRF